MTEEMIPDPQAPEVVPTPAFHEPVAVPPPTPSASAAPSFPHRPARSMATAMLAAGLVIGSIGGGAIGATLASRHASSAPLTPTTFAAASAAAAPAPAAGSYAAIYQAVAPGVVTISTQTGTRASSFGQAEGSGLVVDKAGDILTNAHVVANATQIQVTFNDGSTAVGTVKGVSQSDDLAVVKVSVSADKLHPLTVGNSDTLQVGEPALAIGTPFGLANSFTAGIISGLNRSTTAPNNRALTGMIQTDAPINPGNSGGALLDGKGRLIGINDSIQSPVEGNVGIGFAIPINRAQKLLPQLEAGTAIQHAWLGISGQTITTGTADQLGLSEKAGVLVVSVVPGAPASKAGLRANGTPSTSDDIITAIDGHATPTIESLTQYLDTKNVGDKVTLSVTRGGQHIQVQVTLGNFTSQPAVSPTP
ncbi:MAG: trypsin-like peptidase domain-containing protein [Candidatus Dormibacteraeota bacterium]|nr:trypsin-like peptidase domain-containing protein [Candidatus Dormibacteraeota bacterium]